MSALTSPHVTAGNIAVTRLYDMAYSVDLDRLERESREATTRLRLSPPKPKAVYYARPHVDVALGAATLTIGDDDLQVDVRARIYDFGAVRLSYEHSVKQMEWAEYVGLVNQMEAILERSDPWDGDLSCRSSRVIRVRSRRARATTSSATRTATTRRTSSSSTPRGR